MQNGSVDPGATPVSLTWKAGQVAHALGFRSTDAFHKQRPALEQSFGFPAKLPGLNAWSIAAVTHWVKTNGNRYQSDEPGLGDDHAPADLAGVVVSLEQRYARGRAA